MDSLPPMEFLCLVDLMGKQQSSFVVPEQFGLKSLVGQLDLSLKVVGTELVDFEVD